ncbi:hypothetical protein ASO20_02695 [Mycoplasma sp. (ex Biomphalaria glabrata)]|uniref:NAD-dependent epimerase/dehydratase family protein n=1 Tax=Mycoplasma sp. (ex Biomphalaria glabrata) TaxID=1749074 RepID=UPI00073AB877|nr:NAD-dependent epimerase/dehydratase family protein [Mycoplasma sp. (ex Biomphalaria glabrata)]ALV23543.1 hypothetical protein ASO20_02695 [Mycoplasma sp. (ex Biomphalaria glabrata)]
MTKKIIVLGATGSVGSQALEVIKENKNLELIGISFHRNSDKASQIIHDFPELKFVIISDISYEIYGIKNYHLEDLENLIDKYSPDIVVNAITGVHGIEATMCVLKKKTKLCLANKESILLAGHIISSKYPAAFGKKIFPIDSEITALNQCLANRAKKEINYAYITMSGGALRNKTYEELNNVTIEDALKHPTWVMGKKITIDSASLVNKIFEVIETHYYFDLTLDKIIVLLHYNSFMHAAIQFRDGSLVLSCYYPSMKISIAQAIQENYDAKTIDTTLPSLTNNTKIEFLPSNEYQKFALSLLDLIKQNPLLSIPLAILDDIYVDKFLNKEISFLDIINNLHFELKKYLYLKFDEVDTLEKVLSFINRIKEQKY